MKTTACKLIGYAIIALCILASCDNDEGFTYEPYIRGYDWSWGYMHGTVERPLTGEKISVNHVQHPSLRSRQGRGCEYWDSYTTHFHRMGFRFNGREAYNYEVWERTEEMLPSLSTIGLTLVNDFRNGCFEIVDGDYIVSLDNGSLAMNRNHSISIEIYDDAEHISYWAVKPHRYVPDKDEPFLVHLDIVEFNMKFEHSPVLEGRLEGVLYREDNPKDYMVVDISFGM